MKRLTFVSMLLLVAIWTMPVFGAQSPTDPYQPHDGLMYRANLYSRTPGFQLAFGGLTSMSTANNDTIYVAQWDWDADDAYDDYDADQFMGYGMDDYIGGGDFFLRVCMTADSAAPYGEEREIRGFDSDAGMIIVSPTFTATVGQDEYVMVIHRSLIGKTKGQLRYHGTIDLLDGETTGITDGNDSLYVVDLTGFGNDYWELGDYWLHFTKTTDGGAPQGQWRPVLNSVSATGCMTFTTAFSVEATILDEVELVHYSLVPDNVKLGQCVYESIVASGNTTTAVLTDLIGAFPDDYFNRGDYWAHYVYTTDGAAPIDEYRAVTDWVSSTGTVTTGAFTAAATAGDYVELIVADLVPPHFRYVGVEWSDWNELVIDFSSATWNTVATQEALAVTGDVLLELAIACSTNCTDTSADSLWWFMGESGATGMRMFSACFDDIQAGESLIPAAGWARGWIWDDAGDAGSNDLTSNMTGGTITIQCHMGKDVGFEISDHAATGGIIVVWYRYLPLSTGSSVADGAGGTL